MHAKSAMRLGVKGSTVYNVLINKVRLQIMEDFGLGFLFTSGALLTRLMGEPPDDEWEMDRGHIYWNAHVDKANIATYDYSALLYLNNFGTDFEGGEFEFIDNDANRIVEPRAGRLILFTSGDTLPQPSQRSQCRRQSVPAGIFAGAAHEAPVSIARA